MADLLDDRAAPRQTRANRGLHLQLHQLLERVFLVAHPPPHRQALHAGPRPANPVLEHVNRIALDRVICRSSNRHVAPYRDIHPVAEPHNRGSDCRRIKRLIVERRDFLKYVAASALAGGCGRYLPGENVLEIANLQPPAAQVPINQLMWRAIERFRETHPEVHVEPASGGGGGYQELMIRVMEGHPPDIMSFATAETGLTYAYVEQGHVLDITEHLQRPSWDTPGKTWLETLDPLYRGPLTYKGRFYAIPQNVISLQVYCNAELYQRAGADLNPQTWDQFLDNCERLKRAGIVPITQDGIHWYTSWWFDHLAQRILGADKVRQAFRDPQRQTPWTEPGFLQAARMIEYIRDRGYFAEGFAGLNHIESELLFWQGRAATVFVGSWFTSGRTAVIGKDFPLYAFRFPAVQGGHGNPHDLIGTVNTQSIPTLARQPERAAEFLRLVNSRWFQEQMVQQAQMISPLTGMPLPGI
ncbi:MAG: extracellular solute-binding protein, partial [Gemmatimonadetes bacterium]|nr:extracellular solute-binding protein [Gemmatimonadota bacterium]